METKKFKPFFNGYLKAVAVSLLSLYALFIISIGVLDWFFFIYVFFAIIASVLHVLFLLLLYMVLFPAMSALDQNAGQTAPGKLMDRYIPFFAVPFAVLFGIIWIAGTLNKFFTFSMLDILFTCYIGLYYYVKNKCSIDESA